MNRRTFLASLSAGAFSNAAAPLLKTVAQVLPKARLPANLGLVDVGKVKVSPEILKFIYK